MNASVTRVVRTPEQIADAKAFYTSYLKSFEKGKLSNSMAFDKAILTYSAGALALSLGFMKDYALETSEAHLWMLTLSWMGFVLSIIATILSYLIAPIGNEKTRLKAENYYLHAIEPTSERNRYSLAVDGLAWASGLLFCAGAIFTTSFVVFTLEDKKMVTNSNEKVGGHEQVQKAAGEPAMTRIPITTTVPSTQPTTQTDHTGGTDTNQGDGKK